MNPSKVCVICEANSDTNACPKCQRRMTQHLLDIQRHYKIAHEELLPTRNGDGRSTERGLGVRIQALDLIAGNEFLPWLESWERMFRQEWGYAAWGPTTEQRAKKAANPIDAYMAGTIEFQTAHMSRIADHPAVGDYASEIRQIYYQTRAAARQQPPEAYRVNCPADQGQSECGNSLRFSPSDIHEEIQCKKCGSLWTIARLMLVVESTGKPIWTDLEAAATHFSLHPSTIRKWAKASSINKKGNQYDLQSIRTHIELSKQKAQDRASMQRT